MIDWIVAHRPAWNSWMALGLYWMPLVLCAYGYLLRAIRKYREELANRAKAEADPKAYYRPTLTVGTIVGGAVLTVTPIANLFAAVFDVAPEVFSDLFSWLGKVLDIPLVPKRKDPQP